MNAIPQGFKAIPTRYLPKVKRYPDGSFERCKVRLVVQGNRQDSSVFDSLYAPVVDLTCVRMLCATAARQNWAVQQLDIKNAFLHADLEEETYVRLPDGRLARLRKALNGLVQAPLVWNETLDAKLTAHGFVPSDADPCLYYKEADNDFMLLVVWVDDLLVTGPAGHLEEFSALATDNLYCRSVGDNAFVGIDIVQERDYIRLHQGGYIQIVLERFGMVDCKPIALPMDTKADLSCEGDALTNEPFDQLIGCLRWIVTCVRPDIAFVVGILSRHLKEPKVHHWKAAKRVLRYLSGTKELGLCYQRGATDELIGFSDADFAGDSEGRRSTEGCIFLYAGAPVCWRSSLQRLPAGSTMEAELCAARHSTYTAVWFRKVLEAITGTPRSSLKPIVIYGDNHAALALINNPKRGSSAKSKHIDRVFTFPRVGFKMEKCPICIWRASSCSLIALRNSSLLFCSLSTRLCWACIDC